MTISACSHNGSTELWLGTTHITGPEHHIEDSGWIKKSSLIERAKVRSPCYGHLPKVSQILTFLSAFLDFPLLKSGIGFNLHP
jgi:hypothetical protein